MNKDEKYRLLTEQIKALVEGETDAVAVMANVAAAIHETTPTAGTLRISAN